MRQIKAIDGNLWRIPVILAITDAPTRHCLKSIETAFFTAVQNTYGNGWGRLLPLNVNISSPTINVFGDCQNERELFAKQRAYPIGKEYADKLRLFKRKAARMYHASKERNEIFSLTMAKWREYILKRTPQSPFPMLILLRYVPSSDLTDIVSSAEQGKILEQIVAQLNRSHTVVDAVFIDNEHYGLDGMSYTTANIPDFMSDIPVYVFDNAEQFTETLVKDDIFLTTY